MIPNAAFRQGIRTPLAGKTWAGSVVTPMLCYTGNHMLALSEGMGEGKVTYGNWITHYTGEAAYSTFGSVRSFRSAHLPRMLQGDAACVSRRTHRRGRYRAITTLAGTRVLSRHGYGMAGE